MSQSQATAQPIAPPGALGGTHTTLALVPGTTHTTSIDPFAPFAMGRCHRNKSAPSRCFLRCCSPPPGALDTFKTNYRAAQQAEQARKGASSGATKEPSDASYTARYRAALRSKSFTKLSCSKTNGFVSYTKVVYERCRMNFCFGWSDADVRGLIALGGTHPYILPKPDGHAQFSNNPDFRSLSFPSRSISAGATPRVTP